MTLELIDLSTNENPLGPSPRVVEADHAFHRLAEHGIQVRSVAGPGRIPCLRISIGRPETTQRVIDALASLQGTT